MSDHRDRPVDAFVPGWIRSLGDLPPPAPDDGTTVRTSKGDGEPGRATVERSDDVETLWDPSRTV